MEQHQVLLMEKEQVQQQMEKLAHEIIDKIDQAPLSDWINESKASDLLGYSNRQHLRMLAKENGIKVSKRGKKFYYSLQSINNYLESGTIKDELS